MSRKPEHTPSSIRNSIASIIHNIFFKYHSALNWPSTSHHMSPRLREHDARGAQQIVKAKEDCCKIVSCEDDRAILPMNPQNLHKIKLVNIPYWRR